jgi:hypothetical protein
LLVQVAGIITVIRTTLKALALLAIALPARADGPSISIELNKLEANGAACRAYMVLNNSAGEAFESLKLDLVMFGTDGVVARRLAVETAPLAAGKTILKVFDIADQPCNGIGRVLLNDILTCRGAEPRNDCLALVQTTSRAAAPFFK